VFLVQIAKELGPRNKLAHQGEQAHETEGRAHQEQEHANNRHAGVEEGQVEAVHACNEKAQVNTVLHMRSCRVVGSVADPGSGAFLTPRSGTGKKSGSGSGMDNPDHIS
jgi:hypothetical protein